MLNVLRSMPLPRFRLLRNTLLSTLGMAAIVVGLLAMHSAGAEHANLAEVSAVSAHSHATAPDGADTLMVSGGLHCDNDCMQGVMDCALMVMGCAMLLTFAALVVFAHRPGMFQALLDAGGRLVRAVRNAVPSHTLRPDLVVLSISRT
ncbi:hypothetical protein ROT00_07410 [Agromyces mediolanus]|uniref:hypothetical protein n=1 Tax=Agromyces mediolanus TaxID=41986 RepID=UPI003835F38D